MPILSSRVSVLWKLQPVWEMWAIVWHESGLGALNCNPRVAGKTVISHIWSWLIILGRQIWKKIKETWSVCFMWKHIFTPPWPFFAIIRMSVLVIRTKEMCKWKQKCSHEQIAAMFLYGYAKNTVRALAAEPPNRVSEYVLAGTLTWFCSGFDWWPSALPSITLSLWNCLSHFSALLSVHY